MLHLIQPLCVAFPACESLQICCSESFLHSRRDTISTFAFSVIFSLPPSYHSHIYAFSYKPFFSLPFTCAHALYMNISIYRKFSIRLSPF
jgi:hypothetical protein